MEASQYFDQELIELQNSQIQKCAENAVFTVSQNKEIIRLDVVFNHFLLKKIDDLSHKLSLINNADELKELEKKIECLRSEILFKHSVENDIEKLIAYDENNTEIIAQVKREVEHNESELHKMEERIALTLVSQANEIEKLVKENKINSIQSAKISHLENILEEMRKELCVLEKRELKDERVDAVIHLLEKLATKDEIKEIICDVAMLKHREMKDERVEQILRRIASLEAREMKDDRIDTVLSLMTALATKKELSEIEYKLQLLEKRAIIDHRVDEVLKRLACLEAKEMKDYRVDKIIEALKLFETKEDIEKIIKRVAALESKEFHDKRVDLLLSEISKLEVKLNESIKTNLKQSEEIRCLSEKLNRNTLALDGKIDEVERHELVNEKLDYDQNASLKFMQSEISRLAQDIERLQKVALIKPV